MLAAYRHFLCTEFVSVPKISAFSQTIRSTKVSTTLGAALPEDGIRIAFQNFGFLKFRRWTKSKTGDCVSECRQKPYSFELQHA